MPNKKEELNEMVKQVAERYGLEYKEDKEQLTIKLENGKIMVVGNEDICKVFGLDRENSEAENTWYEYIKKHDTTNSFGNTKHNYIDKDGSVKSTDSKIVLAEEEKKELTLYEKWQLNKKYHSKGWM
ncbi:hypothetical protein 000TH008_258 [Bacillus phage 000TH008]|nr:hypothetical protein 000TH008_258 [Bacillus phage 000TH008]QQO40951.1 hypothetical protein 000TH009_258 [Bacillus phage 000TH009]